MEIRTVEVNAARNVEIFFEQSFEVAKYNVERVPAVRKKSARIVSKFIAIERNLDRTDLTLTEDLNSGISKQIAIGDDKSLIVAGMAFCK